MVVLSRNWMYLRKEQNRGILNDLKARTNNTFFLDSFEPNPLLAESISVEFDTQILKLPSKKGVEKVFGRCEGPEGGQQDTDVG